MMMIMLINGSFHTKFSFSDSYHVILSFSRFGLPEMHFTIYLVIVIHVVNFSQINGGMFGYHKNVVIVVASHSYLLLIMCIH